MNKKLFVFIAVMSLIKGLNCSESIELDNNQSSIGDIEDFAVHRTYAVGPGQPRNLVGNLLRERNASNQVQPRSFGVSRILSFDHLISAIPRDDMSDSDENSYSDNDQLDHEESFQEERREDDVPPALSMHNLIQPVLPGEDMEDGYENFEDSDEDSDNEESSFSYIGR
ncbi:hypothetical protein JST56_01275 [Candidatus Dependentiae bacterium]|nr:hypothetical protein [Candidatus Dependentiae bacterium]